MRVWVVQAPCRGELAPDGYAVRRFAFGAAEGGRAGEVNLLVLDTRRFESAGLASALERMREWRDHRVVRQAVMICPVPTLPLTVAAMRAGVRDILPLAPGPGRLLRLLRGAIPKESRGRGQGRAMLSAVRSLLRLDQRTGSESIAIERAREDMELTRRREDQAREAERLQALRHALSEREARLERRQSRLAQDLEHLHAGREEAADMARTTKLEARERELAERARELERRAAELEVREMMLKDLDALLEQSSRPPFAFAGSNGSLPPLRRG